MMKSFPGQIFPILAIMSGFWGCNSPDSISVQAETELAVAAITSPGTGFIEFPGLANDLAFSSDGTLFAIGNDGQVPDHSIWRIVNGSWKKWEGGGAGVRIAVDPQGKPWIINSSHQIFAWSGSAWVRKPGLATDIGIGGDGSVYITSYEFPAPSVYGQHVMKWTTNNDWERFGAGVGERITVNKAGQPTLVNSYGQIWKWNGSRFERLPGLAGDIAANPNTTTTLAKTGSTGGVALYSGSQWVNTTCGDACTARSVALGNPPGLKAGTVYFSDEHDNIYRSK